MNNIPNCFYVGQCAEFTKKITDEDVISFSLASGDKNPVHISDDAAKNSMFGRRIAHGILVGGLISAVIANKLPGNGTIYLGQSFKFTNPTFIGDIVTAKVKIIEIDTEKNRIHLETVCVNQHGDTVIAGEAVVLPPDETVNLKDNL